MLWVLRTERTSDCFSNSVCLTHQLTFCHCAWLFTVLYKRIVLPEVTENRFVTLTWVVRDKVSGYISPKVLRLQEGVSDQYTGGGVKGLCSYLLLSI